jgi:plastocyanin domain-containing protein
MSGNEWLVVAGGLAAITWVNWYFLLAGPRREAVRAATSGSREVRITVDGGYEPALIKVPAGEPVRLLFDRRDTSPCSEEVVFPDFGIRQFLPPARPRRLKSPRPNRGNTNSCAA